MRVPVQPRLQANSPLENQHGAFSKQMAYRLRNREGLMSNEVAGLNFDGDQLDRRRFVNRLTKYITAVADSDSLPAGRVIAVNAPWGSGKSWIAERLAPYLERAEFLGRPGVYINAFQFDFHQDPFAVLASAILETTKKTNQTHRSLKAAATAVLKSATPAIAKGVVKATAARVIGKEGTDALVEALADGSEKAISSMLETFTATRRAADAFKEKLSKLATEAPGPLVVIVDELDRCRPTFALEMLERMKHLFDVPGLVFVLFFHKTALTSAIHQTYGETINADAYLRKFISVNVELPPTLSRRRSVKDEPELFRNFIASTYSGAIRNEEQDFRTALGNFAPAFGATLRDVQTVMLMAALLGREAFNFGELSAYALLLRLFDPSTLDRIRKREATAFQREEQRLAPYIDSSRHTKNLWEAFRLEGNQEQAEAASPAELQSKDQMVDWMIRAAVAADLEYVSL